MRYNIIFSLIALLMLGCSSSSKELYVLSTAKDPATKYESKKSSIGVEEVVIPKYLARREISAAKSSSKLFLLNNAIWGEHLDEGLTNRLISYFQKKFQQPAVYSYPWEGNQTSGLKVKVQITRFIAQEEHLYLDANWEINSLNSGKRFAKLFSTVVATGATAEEIVRSMDRAFGELEEQIAEGIHQF